MVKLRSITNIKSKPIIKNEKQGSPNYKLSYFCSNCGEFVPKEKAVKYTTKNKKYHYLICPNFQDCGKFKLKLRPSTRKFKDKYLQGIERIA